MKNSVNTQNNQTQMKQFFVEFNSCIVSYVTAKTLKIAIKEAKKEFPEHFKVTNSGICANN